MADLLVSVLSVVLWNVSAVLSHNISEQEDDFLLQLVRRQHHAAITIQAHYRGHVHRHNLVG